MIPGLQQGPEPSQEVAGTVRCETIKLETLLFNNVKVGGFPADCKVNISI